MYLRPYPGPGSEVVVSNDGGREPVWSPDGLELFYRDEAFMVAVDLSEAGRPRTPQRLWRDRYLLGLGVTRSANCDIHPDGQRFLMVGNPAGQSQLVVVVNWAEELRQRVPN